MMLIMALYLLYDFSLPATAEKSENEENLMENGPHFQFFFFHSAVGLAPQSPSIKGGIAEELSEFLVLLPLPQLLLLMCIGLPRLP